MADKIVFRHEEMHNKATQIRNLAQNYQNCSSTFRADFLASLKSWEGASKESVKEFLNGSVQEYLETSIPKLLEALATILEANIEQMQTADQQIADSIPKSLN